MFPVSPSAQDTVQASPSLSVAVRRRSRPLRDSALAGDDRGVAGAAAAVGDDGRGPLHQPAPSWVGHVGHDDVAGLMRAISEASLSTRTVPAPIL